MSRYDRQERLSEVGALGQARLGQVALSTPTECSADEARFAQLYAERCGMRVENQPIEAASASGGSQQTKVRYPTHVAKHYKHEASRSVGVGATIALSHAVSALFEQP